MGQELHQSRVLIVEDEWIIAETIQDVLESAGFSVQGPAGRVDDALKIIQDTALDLALLDVSLRGQNSFEIARALAARSVPFIFMTGYVSNELPEDLRGRPVLNKPVDDAKLVGAVEQILAASR